MSATRVLVAQGPSQLIAALAAWEYLAARPGAGKEAWDDVLVLGGFCASGQAGQELDAVCRQVAKSWGFRRIVSTASQDSAFENGQLGFEAYIDSVVRQIGVTTVEQVYVCRNMQQLNEAVLFAWPRARKICYGDLGMIDLNGTSWCKPTRTSGYPQVDEVITHAPVEVTSGAFATFPLTCIPTACFLSALTKASAAIKGLDAFCRQLMPPAARKTVLVCLSNLTEGGSVNSLEQELLLYERCLEPYLEKGTFILLKGHPRETRNQSGLLAERLRSRNYDARSLAGMSAVPIDLFANTLHVDLLLTLLSHSGVLWRLRQPKTDIMMGVAPEVIKEFVRPEALAQFHLDESAALTYLLTLMATRWEFLPIRMETLRRALKVAPAMPVLLKGRAAMDGDCLADDPAADRFWHAALGLGGWPRPSSFLRWLRSWSGLRRSD